MDENRWLLISGAVILILISLVGTFSLGVYVGRHGLSQEGLRYQPSQPDKIPQPNTGARPPGLPDGDPDVIGAIRALSPQGLQLATKDGPRIVEVDDVTQIIDPQGQSLSLLDLRLGDIIAVFGEFSVGNGERLLASSIVRLPPRAPDEPRD